MNNIDNTAIAYVKDALGKFIVLFPHTKVRYEHDSDAHVHCVEIVPNEVYRLDSEYIAWENNFTDAFIEQFPDQNICFISDDALVGMDVIHLELTGRNYSNLISVNNCNTLNSLPTFTSSTSYFNMEKISTSCQTYNQGGTISASRITNMVESANGIFAMKNTSPELFTPNYSMAA